MCTSISRYAFYCAEAGHRTQLSDTRRPDARRTDANHAEINERRNNERKKEGRKRGVSFSYLLYPSSISVTTGSSRATYRSGDEGLPARRD